MWTRIVSISAALAVTLYGHALVAEQPVCSQAQPGSLWTQTPWLRLEIVGGRLAVGSARCGQHRLASESAADSSARQSLLIQVQPGSLTAHYEQHDQHGELTLSVDERNRLTIVRRFREGAASEEVRYEQPATGDVTLSIGGKRPQKFAAASLWHLLLTEREAGREHLLPILAQLRPNWRLGEQLDEAEAALLARAGEDALPLRRQWQTWVEQLAGDSFAARQAADFELRAAGQPALGFLRHLDAGELDPEQRRRIAGILAAATPADADCPARVADWLLTDKRVWLSLLGRGELAGRIEAARHLSRLCGRSLAFDPEGNADLRQAQLAELQAKLAEN